MTANPLAWTFRAQFLAGFVLSYALIGALSPSRKPHLRMRR